MSTIGSLERCPICGVYRHETLGLHKCLPQWSVWPDDGADEQDADRIRAETAQDAAEEYVSSMTDNSEIHEGEVKVWVRKEGDDTPSAWEVEVTYSPRFHASPVLIGFGLSISGGREPE